jgi:hypothetical protein
LRFSLRSRLEHWVSVRSPPSRSLREANHAVPADAFGAGAPQWGHRSGSFDVALCAGQAIDGLDGCQLLSEIVYRRTSAR